MTKVRFVAAASLVAVGVPVSAAGRAGAAHEWFELGAQTIKSTDPSVEIESEGGRFEKDVKQVKLSVEGADVEIARVVLQWDDRGRKGRLTAAAVQYKIRGDAPIAPVKVWGFDGAASGALRASEPR